jgi:hypothetical protein
MIDRAVWMKGILVVLLAALGLSACGSQPVGPHVGQWRTSSGETWEFFEDGTVTVTNIPQPLTGTYELEDDTLVHLTFEGQQAVVATIEVSGNQMRIIGDTLGVLEFIRVRQQDAG